MACIIYAKPSSHFQNNGCRWLAEVTAALLCMASERAIINRADADHHQTSEPSTFIPRQSFIVDIVVSGWICKMKMENIFAVSAITFSYLLVVSETRNV